MGAPHCSVDEKKRHLGGVNKSTFLTSLAYLIEPDRATYTGITRQEEVERAAANVALFEALDTDKVGDVPRLSDQHTDDRSYKRACALGTVEQ